MRLEIVSFGRPLIVNCDRYLSEHLFEDMLLKTLAQSWPKVQN